MDRIFNIIIAGVGGQGILTASEILAKVAMEVGLDAKKSEVHGMSQRGGSVVSHVRFGKKVYSPLVEKGACDIILSFEKSEALRWVHYLKEEGGKVVINDLEIIPTTVSLKLDTYPTNIEDQIRDKAKAEVILVPATDLARQAGDARTANTVLLGVISNFLPFEDKVWEKVISDNVKKETIEVNLKAFYLGKNYYKK
ncbi:MAG: indolepyruvate oxidoreductase subunit beta [candidate division WOR-3 bacterium]|jgi:indolepyruvate ferredoxin oxidoreductase beta subunit